jgi:hypothetical protein
LPAQVFSSSSSSSNFPPFDYDYEAEDDDDWVAALAALRCVADWQSADHRAKQIPPTASRQTALSQSQPIAID